MLDILIVGGIVLIGCLIGYTDSSDDKGFGAFVGGFVAFFAGMISFAIISAVWLSVPEKTNEWRIYALATGSQTTGTFFLGGGTIDQDPVYTYMYRNGDGTYGMGWAKTREVRIKMTDTETPHIEKWQACVPRSQLVLDGVRCGDPTYVAVVPEGSIWTGFEVDVRDAG